MKQDKKCKSGKKRFILIFKIIKPCTITLNLLLKTSLTYKKLNDKKHKNKKIIKIVMISLGKKFKGKIKTVTVSKLNPLHL